MALAVAGCSYGTVTTKKDNPSKCTRHYGAPVADTLGATALVPVSAVTAFVAAQESKGWYGGGDDKAAAQIYLVSLGLLTAAVYTGMSAHHGYTKVAECRTGRVDSDDKGEKQIDPGG